MGRSTLLLGAVLAAVAVSPRTLEARAAATCKSPVSVALAGSTYRYRVKVERGAVSCSVARGVLRTFIATKKAPAGWACFRGHGSNRWAAVCSRRTALVRAYPLR